MGSEVFYEKLTLVYLEMPKFNKGEDGLITMSDKWMFVLHNLARLMERPAALQERVVSRLFEAAEIAKFDRKELVEYEDSLKVFWDMYSVVETAKNKGRAEGLAEGRAEGLAEGLAEGEKRKQLEIAQKMKAFGTPVEVVGQLTGLSTEKVSDQSNRTKTILFKKQIKHKVMYR